MNESSHPPPAGNAMKPERARELGLGPEVSDAAAPSGRGLLGAVLLCVALAGLGVGAAAWLLNPRERPAAAAPAPVAIAPTAPPENPVPEPASGDLLAAGYVTPAPPFPITISPLLPGRLESFRVLEGQAVRRGEVIAHLNADEWSLRRAELQAELTVLTTRAELRQREARRLHRLSRSGAATEQELDAAVTEAAALEAEAGKLRAELRTVEWRIAQCVVRAPVDGVIYERKAAEGAYINLEDHTEIASLYDPTKLLVTADVPQREAGRLRPGQRCEVRVDGDDRALAGRVADILPRASLTRNAVHVRVTLDDTSPVLRPEMNVRVKFLPEPTPTAAAR